MMPCACSPASTAMSWLSSLQPSSTSCPLATSQWALGSSLTSGHNTCPGAEGDISFVKSKNPTLNFMGAHRCMAHGSLQTIINTLAHTTGMKLSADELTDVFCAACALGTSTRRAHSRKKAISALEPHNINTAPHVLCRHLELTDCLPYYTLNQSVPMAMSTTLIDNKIVKHVLGGQNSVPLQPFQLLSADINELPPLPDNGSYHGGIRYHVLIYCLGTSAKYVMFMRAKNQVSSKMLEFFVDHSIPKLPYQCTIITGTGYSAADHEAHADQESAPADGGAAAGGAVAREPKTRGLNAFRFQCRAMKCALRATQ